MSQESDNDGFFAGFAALENEENDQSYTDNNHANKSTFDTSSSNNSDKNNLKTVSNVTKPMKYNKLIPENSQSSQTDESETEEDCSKENTIPENHPGYSRKNLNESADTEEENGMRNERHRSERAYINHLKGLKCADTDHVKPATTATSTITKPLPNNFLEATLIATPHQHQIMNILNYRCLKDKQEAFSPQIILERLTMKPIMSESSSVSNKNSERARQAQQSAAYNRKEQILSSLETWSTGCLDMAKNLEKTTVAELNVTQKVRNSDIFDSYKNMERVVVQLGSIVKEIKK